MVIVLLLFLGYCVVKIYQTQSGLFRDHVIIKNIVKYLNF